MNIREMIAEQLDLGSYDGLFNSRAGCACENWKLFPCGECFDECRPGYKVPCDCGEHDFHIVAEKPEHMRKTAVAP